MPQKRGDRALWHLRRGEPRLAVLREEGERRRARIPARGPTTQGQFLPFLDLFSVHGRLGPGHPEMLLPLQLISWLKSAS